MKVFATLAVLLFCGFASARDERLSDECLRGIRDRNECCAGVPDAWYAHLRNPEDCASFYQCEHGQATWKACAEGTHWSVEADLCDWPENANCTVDPRPESSSAAPESTPVSSTARPRPTSTSAPTSSPAPPSTTSAPSSTTSAPPSTTSAPSSTTSAAPSTTSAPPSTTSAPPSTTSAPPSNNNTRPPPPQEDECAPAPVCHQCLNGIFPADLCCRDVETYHKLRLADASDCSSYYQCVNGNAIRRPCPAGLHWSVNSDQCEWPSVAQCNATGNGNGDNGNGDNGNGGNNGGNGGNNGGNGGNNGDNGGNNGGNGGNNGDNNGGNNGGNDNGNNDGNNNDDGNNNGNGNSNVSEDCLNGNVSAEECCRNVPYWEDVLLQNNADCHTYIQCVHGSPLVRPCPANLRWSITANRCEWLENATCTW